MVQVSCAQIIRSDAGISLVRVPLLMRPPSPDVSSDSWNELSTILIYILDVTVR